MKHLVFLAVVLAVIASNASDVNGAAEAPSQNDNGKQERRMSLIRAARAINVTEVDQQANTGRYADWKTLAESVAFRKNGVNLPPLTSVRVFVDVDGTHFSLSLADTQDACMYTVFSNETGIVYEGLVTSCKTK